jgi:hypothetical protein
MDDELQMAEVPGFPGYFIRSDGKAFFADGREKTISCKKGRSAKLIIRVNYKMYTLGFATLIAEAFIPNPWKHTLVIFKNRNHHNCHKNNIAWVDNETYNYYCTLGKRGNLKGRPKIYINRDEAIKTCTDQNLKNYYTTMDERWIEIAWNEVDKKLSEIYYWREVKSEVYLYFIDRVKRFSILGTPKALMYIFAKYQHFNQRKTISPSIPAKHILQIDESLRTINRRY